MTWHACLLTLALASLLHAPLAAASDSDELSGSWAFRTEIRKKGCEISGTMTIYDADESGARTCRFQSSETCGPVEPPTEMEQSCRVLPQGNYLLITSRVERSLTDGRPIDFYMADNFTVRPTGPGRLEGTWYDRLFSDFVVFWRPDQVPVS